MLDSYFKRTGFAGNPKPDAESLRAVHFAHAVTIPFENIDALMGRPIKLNLDSLFAKLVENRRGGYCFEQNALFAAVLEQIGFKVTRLAARVRWGAQATMPRTHMILLVEASGAKWLADVGFGGEGLLHPLVFAMNREQEQYGWTYRIIEEHTDVHGHQYVLQSKRPEGWNDLYSFTLEPHIPVDYEVANHYTSTYPASFFTYMLIAQRPGTDKRVRLTNRRYTEETPTGVRHVHEASDEELLEILASRFGLEFPAGTKFPFRES